MATLHFLNVKQGDCSIIRHNSGNITVIDVCNAGPEQRLVEALKTQSAKAEKGVSGNFNQKKYPVNPVAYLRKLDITSIFRFIATHPDMDHVDGIKYLFEQFNPLNFWDTDNNAEKDFPEGSAFNEEDWKFYKKLRDGNPGTDPKRLTLYAGASGKYFNVAQDGSSGGDGLYVLAPTKTLVSDANDCDDHNDCSYVILYRTNRYRIVFGGDSHDKTWGHILKNHKSDVENIDLLIAPHHGRDSDRDYSFLDILKPKMTFFGNANSEHLAYDKWNSRKLPFITNNQAGSMIVDAGYDDALRIYVTHEQFAKKVNPNTFYSTDLDAYYYVAVSAKPKQPAA
jgi:beta-lactamase superfamily II metal-dependent hydrolase